MIRTFDFYILSEIVTCFFSFILTINILLTLNIRELRQRLFFLGGVVCFLLTVSNIASSICSQNCKSVSYVVCYFFTSLNWLLIVYLSCLFCWFVVETVFDNKAIKKNWILVFHIVYLFFSFFVFINIKTGWLFSFNEAGYVKGLVERLNHVFLVIYLFIALFITFQNRKNIARRLKVAFFLYPVLSYLIVLFQYLFKEKFVLTGTAAFSSFLFLYINVQADLVDYDFVTGLLTEKKLQKRLENRHEHCAVFAISIDNMNLLQMHMEAESWTQLMLEIGTLFTKLFSHNAYHNSTNRFTAVVDSLDDVRAKIWSINEFFSGLNSSQKFELPSRMEVYTVATEIAAGEKAYGNVCDILNNLFTKARFNGNKNLVICDESVLLEMERKRLIFNILKRELRLDSKMFEVWFQPIWSLEKQRFTYMEALSRLRGTELGDISPQEFVEVAESKGLIEQLGYVAFEKVCQFIANNRDVVDAVSVNFSVYQMSNTNIVKNVLSTIEKFGLKTSSIIMEITESIFIENFELVKKNMTRLSEAGIKFYLDDFGTGYSNLSNVVKLPFSTVKMDRSLVLAMEESEKNIKFVSNLISTFKGAELNVLVEGVETQKQNDIVKQAGADYIQGFLYSRPQPPEKCLEILRNGQL